MFQVNDTAELITVRTGLYVSPPGARAVVQAVTTGAVTGKQLVRLTWLWAAQGECSGWFEADDFKRVAA